MLYPSQISYGLHISLHHGSGVHDPKQLFRGRDIELGNALHANLLRLQCDHEAHTDTIRGMYYTRSLQIPSLQIKNSLDGQANNSETGSIQDK